MLMFRRALRDRLMVGHRPLEASILVRVQVPQHLLTIRTQNFLTREFARLAPPMAGLGLKAAARRRSLFQVSLLGFVYQVW